MIYLTPIISRAKSKSCDKLKKKRGWFYIYNYRPIQILTNDDQMLILRLSYFITTVCVEKGIKAYTFEYVLLIYEEYS